MYYIILYFPIFIETTIELLNILKIIWMLIFVYEIAAMSSYHGRYLIIKGTYSKYSRAYIIFTDKANN